MGIFRQPELTLAEKVRNSLVQTALSILSRKKIRSYDAVGPSGEKLRITDRTSGFDWLIGREFVSISITQGLRQTRNGEVYEEWQYVIPKGGPTRKYGGIGNVTANREYVEATLQEQATLERFILTWDERR